MALVNRQSTFGLTQEVKDKIDLLTKPSKFEVPVIEPVRQDRLLSRKTELFRTPLRSGGLAAAYSALASEEPPVAPMVTRDTAPYTPVAISLTTELSQEITNEQGRNLSINP